MNKNSVVLVEWLDAVMDEDGEFNDDDIESTIVRSVGILKHDYDPESGRDVVLAGDYINEDMVRRTIAIPRAMIQNVLPLYLETDDFTEPDTPRD